MTKNGDHLKSIFHPTAPPKPRPASSLNQTLVQGLGEAERDQTRRNNLLWNQTLLWMNIDSRLLVFLGFEAKKNGFTKYAEN